MIQQPAVCVNGLMYISDPCMLLDWAVSMLACDNVATRVSVAAAYGVLLVADSKLTFSLQLGAPVNQASLDSPGYLISQSEGQVTGLRWCALNCWLPGWSSGAM